MNALYGVVGAVRICGSAAMDICNVAAGRADAYIEPGLHIWDIAAGLLILSEAGGVVTDFCGALHLTSSSMPDKWRNICFDVLAVNRPLYDTFLQLVHQCAHK